MPFRRLALTFVLSGLSLFANAHPALAGTVSYDGARVLFVAASGEQNDVTLSRRSTEACVGYWEIFYCTPETDDRLVVRDAAGGITASGDACRRVEDTVVVCAAPSFYAVTLELGDGDDHVGNGVRALSDILDVTVYAGEGNDHLQAGTQIYGGPGDDRISCHCYSDGGAGNDHIQSSLPDHPQDGGPGADVIVAPSGYVTYTTRTAPVTVTLDGLANDGETGEGDNIKTLGVVGGSAGDTLVGASGPDSLDGGPGDDLVVGGDGDDSLGGGDGADRLEGGAGADMLGGAAGADRLDGGDGADTLLGDEGSDWLDGGAGDDRLIGGLDTAGDVIVGGSGTDEAHGTEGNDDVRMRDGHADRLIRCNGGNRDVVTADRDDLIHSTCERVTRG